MNDIKAGDVVMLKSNLSMKMTVESILADSAVCVWFDKESGDHKRQTISLVVLDKYKPVKQFGTNNSKSRNSY